MEIEKNLNRKKFFSKKVTSIFLIMTMMVTLLAWFPKVALATNETIGGIIFLDNNSNGKLEPSDTVLSGVEVELYLYENNRYMYKTETTTETDGYYYFNGLNQNNHYKVKVIPPVGKTFTKIGNGNGGGVRGRLSKVDSDGIKEAIWPTDTDINAGLIAGTVTPPTPVTTDLIDISRTTDASNVQNGNTFTVKYLVTPKPIPVTEFQPEEKQKDIVLVMDTSISMEWVPGADRKPYYNGEKSRLRIIKDVAKNLLINLMEMRMLIFL